MKMTSMELSMAFISSMTGETFERERARRNSVEGWPWAREMAVAPPIVEWEAPVSMTERS